MRLGLLPGQRKQLAKLVKKAHAFDRFRQRTRRAFFLVILGGASATIAGFAAGKSVGTGARDDATKPGHPLDEIALGPIERLEARSLDVLAAIETGRETPALWIGVERLALRALAEPARANARRRLHALASTVRVPESLRSTFAAIAESVRGR
ncbi:MAG TPA: hypothetical protein VK081_04710 [Planctomycetota bacterium]|nr:hypothetical protein [Planctomycetota bacterium]